MTTKSKFLSIHRPHDAREEFVLRYRRANPASRTENTYKITRNGGTCREYTSLVTGETITMCAKYPITKRVLCWMDTQDRMASEQVTLGLI